MCPRDIAQRINDLVQAEQGDSGQAPSSLFLDPKEFDVMAQALRLPKSTPCIRWPLENKATVVLYKKGS